MNYEDMSDWEITRRVVEIRCSGQNIKFLPQEDVLEPINSGVMSDKLKIITESGREQIIDACNNPSDAWPIIKEIWVELMSPPYRGFGSLWDNTVVKYNCGKLRAAMICFLKMKDTEK